MLRFSTLAEKIFIVFSLFVSTSALIPLLINGQDHVSGIGEDPVTPVLFMGIYLVIVLLIIARWKSFALVLRKDIFIWLLVGVALASVFWTIEPDVTPRRSLLLLGTTCFSVYIATRYSFREQLELLGWAFGLIIILSFMFGIGLPSYGVMGMQEQGAHAGAWRGVMTHKNILGRMMVVSSLVFLLLTISNHINHRIYRWLPRIGYILSIALILLTTSKSALIVTLTLTAILPLYRVWRSNYNRLIPFMIAVILVVGGTATLILGNLDFVASALGRDLTLTGRTDLWFAMFDMMSERLLFGYGFNAVWRDWNNDFTAYIWRTLDWKCPYGHNGFIDITAELGIVGLAFFLLSYLSAWVRGIAWLRITKTVEGLWPLMYLTYLLMYNLTESTLVATNNIFWIIYIMIIFSMAVEYEQAKIYSYLSETSGEEQWIEKVVE